MTLNREPVRVYREMERPGTCPIYSLTSRPG
jgi:hypothetical protein